MVAAAAFAGCVFVVGCLLDFVLLPGSVHGYHGDFVISGSVVLGISCGFFIINGPVVLSVSSGFLVCDLVFFDGSRRGGAGSSLPGRFSVRLLASLIVLRGPPWESCDGGRSQAPCRAAARRPA